MLYQCFTNHYQSDPVLYITRLPMISNTLPIYTSLPIIVLVIISPLVANVLPIINLPMALGNLPIAANGLPLVPIGNDMQRIADALYYYLDNTLYKNQLN